MFSDSTYLKMEAERQEVNWINHCKNSCWSYDQLQSLHSLAAKEFSSLFSLCLSLALKITHYFQHSFICAPEHSHAHSLPHKVKIQFPWDCKVFSHLIKFTTFISNKAFRSSTARLLSLKQWMIKRIVFLSSLRLGACWKEPWSLQDAIRQWDFGFGKGQCFWPFHW